MVPAGSAERVTERLTGPASLVLTATVARRYFLEGRTKVEIADELGLSRFKVARLLALARSSGLVRIEITYPGEVDVELSGRLRETYALRHAVVVRTSDDHEVSLREHLGRAAAELLAEVLTAEDVLGLAWARSVSAMAAALPRLPALPVVQLTGALARADGDDSSIDLVREVARRTGGPAHLFFAPFILSDAATARALRQQPDTARAFARFDAVTRAVVGIGQWAPGLSTLYDAADPATRKRLARQGVVTDVAGVFLRPDGTAVATALNERMVGIDAEQLRAIDDVVGIPYGLGKVEAVRAAVHGGYVTSLVTHDSLARALLDPA